MAEYYNGKVLRTSTHYKVGEHTVGTDSADDTEHVLEVVFRSVRINGEYTYVVKTVDDQYKTNKLGIQ